jgi:hypothetical protein
LDCQLTRASSIQMMVFRPYTNYPQTYPLGEDEFTRATLTLSNDQPQLASEVVFPTASEMFGFSVAA